MLGDDLGAGDERRHLLLFLDLPVDIFLDIGVIDIDHHHLGRAARGAARFDGARRPVADLEERHKARGLAAARELFARAAQGREIGAGARAVLEQARFADPQVHDAVLVDQIVVHGLDEARMRLGMLVCGFGLHQLAGEGVDIEMALAGAVDAIGPMQARVEPLRGVGRAALGGEHVAQLVIKGARVVLGGKIAALPAPIGPGAGETAEDLAGIGFRTVALGLGELGERLFVGNRTPEPRGNVVLLYLFQGPRHARLAEIFLRDDVSGDLAPGRRYGNILEPEHHRPVRVADFARCTLEFDTRVGVLACRGKAPLYMHCLLVPQS